jgi:hypothetical protein
MKLTCRSSRRRLTGGRRFSRKSDHRSCGSLFARLDDINNLRGAR